MQLTTFKIVLRRCVWCGIYLHLCGVFLSLTECSMHTPALRRSLLCCPIFLMRLNMLTTSVANVANFLLQTPSYYRFVILLLLGMRQKTVEDILFPMHILCHHQQHYPLPNLYTHCIFIPFDLISFRDGRLGTGGPSPFGHGNIRINHFSTWVLTVISASAFVLEQMMYDYCDWKKLRWGLHNILYIIPCDLSSVHWLQNASQVNGKSSRIITSIMGKRPYSNAS